MTPEELAARHPNLYHVTAPGAWRQIAQLGLLSAASLLRLFEVEDMRRIELTTQRRRSEIRLVHPLHGTAVLNDNLPLSERALAACLEDGLTPRDWLSRLNTRVFFWADPSGVSRLLGARTNRGRRRAVLTFDTLSLARAHYDRIEICPINSGATIRKAARRGLSTHTRMSAKSYADWQVQRGGRDRIVEVLIPDHVPDIARHCVGIGHE